MAKKMEVPEALGYTAEHEWVKVEGRRARVGVTDYAQDALTDVVFVELPKLGKVVKAHETLGVVESVKSVSDIFSPLAGKVVEVNTVLEETPELVNQDPYGKGWYCVLELAAPDEVKNLMTAARYRAQTEHM